MSSVNYIDLFVTETTELIEVLERGLVELESAEEASEIINALFRAAHTVKGNAGMIGANQCVRFTHTMENLLARVRDGELLVDQQVIDTLLASVDVIRGFVAAVAAGDLESKAPGYDEAFASLSEFVDAAFDEPSETFLDDRERTYRIVLTYPVERSPTECEPATLIDELAAMGTLVSVEPAKDTSGARAFVLELTAAVRPGDIEGAVLFAEAAVEIEQIGGPPFGQARSSSAERVEGDTATEPSRLASPATDDVSGAAAVAMGEESGSSAGPRAASAPAKSETAASSPRATRRRGAPVKVDGERVDALLDLVGELSIALSMARVVIGDEHRPQEAKMESLDTIETLGRDIQERVMALGMVPVRETFERMRRPLRDAAHQLGKAVEFKTEGDEAELDRRLLDELADPLKHMVRNAAAHGIEDGDAREAAGKPRSGTVKLRAMQRDGAAIIEIEDDGGGIDASKVLRRARERGLISADATPNEKDTYGLLFAPGFSTAEQVNEIAGRGVGLDVVKQAVEKLRGRIEIDSTLGRGTTFRIRLPLTFAILDGMSVRVANETLSIPMPQVDELLDPETTTFRTVEGKAEYIELRGELLPVVRVASLLALDEAAGSDVGASAGSVVIVHSGLRRFALVVDDVLGVTRNVFKSMDASFRLCDRMQRGFKRPKGIGGATVLSDGRVGYILDVHGLEGMAFG